MASSYPADAYPTLADAPVTMRAPFTASDSSIRKGETPEIKTADASSSELLEQGPPQFRFIDWILGRRGPAHDPNAIATRKSVFDNPHLASHYQPAPEYENLSRFDTNARWTFREERVSSHSRSMRFIAKLTYKQALVRKLDWKVMAWAALSFSALNLDRGSLRRTESTSPYSQVINR
jgi:hypothetical protein